jgi:NADH-quinone oxidoreductase subunit E
MAEDIGNGSTGQGVRGRDLPQPASFSFDAESNAAIERVLAKYPEGRQASGVIPLLDIAQRQMGRTTGSAWIPRVAMDAVASRLA